MQKKLSKTDRSKLALMNATALLSEVTGMGADRLVDELRARGWIIMGEPGRAVVKEMAGWPEDPNAKYLADSAKERLKKQQEQDEPKSSETEPSA